MQDFLVSSMKQLFKFLEKLPWILARIGVSLEMRCKCATDTNSVTVFNSEIALITKKDVLCTGKEICIFIYGKSWALCPCIERLQNPVGTTEFQFIKCLGGGWRGDRASFWTQNSQGLNFYTPF